MSSLVNKLVGDESSACENAPAPAAAANKEPTQKMISQMRQALEPKVDSQLRQGGEEGCTDDCLRRWLTEHKLDAQAAARALTEHATWRIEHVPNGFISDVSQTSAWLHCCSGHADSDRVGWRHKLTCKATFCRSGQYHCRKLQCVF